MVATQDYNIDGHKVIFDPADACRELDKDSIIAIDTETTGLNPWRDNIATIQMYGADTGTLALLQVRDGVVPWQFKELFSNPNRLWIGHNLVGFDLLMLHNAGVPWRNAKYYDTLVGETVVTSAGRRDVSVSLRATVKRRLGLNLNKDIDHTTWNKAELNPEQVAYAVRDVLSLPALRNEQLVRAQDTKQVTALEMEVELMPAVVQMTVNGLPLNIDKLKEFLHKQEEVITINAKKLRGILGPVNLNSPAQLIKALRNIGVEFPNTQAETLVDAAQFGGKGGEIALLLSDYRHAAKRVGMYSDAWISKYVVGGRIHSRFWQCSADTGRMTSSDPNLQQWPRDMRGVIGWKDNMRMAAVDFSQIEIRIAAEISGDTALQKMLDEDDVHSSIGSALLQIPQKDITKAQRKLSKAMVFLLLFAGGSAGLYDYARRGGSAITLPEAEHYWAQFHQIFPGITSMQTRAENRCSRPGPVIIRLPNGLRRILVGRNKKSTVLLNTSIQGTAAVGFKAGIIECHRRGITDYIGAPVHDELVAEVPEKEGLELGREMEDAMLTGMRKYIKKTTVKAELKLTENGELPLEWLQ